MTAHTVADQWQEWILTGESSIQSVQQDLPSQGNGNSSFVLRFDGPIIQQGQDLLLSYENKNFDANHSGITDLSGNALENFVVQLQNNSTLDFTEPEITDGFVTSDGSIINVNISEFIQLDLKVYQIHLSTLLIALLTSTSHP